MKPNVRPSGNSQSAVNVEAGSKYILPALYVSAPFTFASVVFAPVVNVKVVEKTPSEFIFMPSSVMPQAPPFAVAVSSIVAPSPIVNAAVVPDSRLN